jgi:hypothetical protein
MKSLVKNIGSKALVLYVFLFDWPHEMVSEKLPCNINSLLYQLPKSIHAVSAPLAPVETALAPLVHSQSLTLVLAEVATVGVPCRPLVVSVSVLLAIEEIAFVDLSYLQDQLASSVLHVVLPLAVVDVSILVLVGSLEAEVVSELAAEYIAVEKDEFSLHLLVAAPDAAEDSAFAEVVGASALLLALLEVADVVVLVDVLEVALAVRHVVEELSRVGAAVAVDHASLAVLAVVLEGADVVVPGELVEVVAAALPDAVAPLALVELLLAVVDAVAVLEVVLPGAVVVGHAVVVEVDALALHHAVVDQSVVDLPVGEDVDALAVEDVALPRAQEDVSALVGVDALPLPQLARSVDLPHVDAAIRVVDFDYVSDVSQPLEEL